MRSEPRTATGASHPPLVVELVGTPGAGKSTVADELVRVLHAAGRQATTVVGGAREHAARTVAGALVARCTTGRWRRALLWTVFYASATAAGLACAARRPALMTCVLGAQARRARLRRRCHTVYWFVQLLGRVRLLARTAAPGEVLVVDDGYLHRAVHLFASERAPTGARDVARYVDLAPRPDLVVWVRAPTEVCEARVRARGVWAHSRHLTTAELARFVADSARVVGVAVDRARASGWKVVEVHNHDELPHVVAAEVARTLTARAAGRATVAAEPA
jgi:thymidylate kinase